MFSDAIKVSEDRPTLLWNAETSLVAPKYSPQYWKNFPSTSKGAKAFHEPFHRNLDDFRPSKK